MTTELIIASKSQNKLWECSGIVRSVTWTTNRTGTPGKLTLSGLDAKQMELNNGDIVRFSVDGSLQFYGWVFSHSHDRWGETELTCYDRLRYLKANASYAFYGQTAGDIIKQIAEDYQLTISTLDNTGYPLPSYIAQDQSCMDIIQEVVQQTLLNTGKVWVFFDDGKGLCLREAGAMMSNVLIGDKSLLTEYNYKNSIDQQTYNSVKLSRPNEATGRSDVFIAQDSETIGRWGLLQLYQTVDGADNDAAVKARAAATLQYYNREIKTLSVSTLGIPGLRAGQMIFIRIPGVPDLSTGRYVLLDKVSHTYQNDTHTMDIDTLPL